MDQNNSPIGPNTEHLFEEKHLSDFCRGAGFKFSTVGGLFWKSHGFRLFSPWPAYRTISLTPQDLNSFWADGALFLHYVSSDDKPFFPGYDLLVTDKNYDFDSIQSSKRRHHIRWALKHCSVERISFDCLAKSALPLIEDTHKRQGRRFNSSAVKWWQKYFRLAESNPLFDAWGVFVSGTLAACSILIRVGTGGHIEMTFSRTDTLRYHPVDALAYVSTQQTIVKDNIKYVSYGRRPINGEPDSLLDFKESMGFKRVPIRQRMEINPIVKPLVVGSIGSLVQGVSEWFYDRSHHAKMIVGVVRTLRGQIGLP
jgi:hypothetical protein